jgi:cobalt-zinc-cadmium efflux system protein
MVEMNMDMHNDNQNDGHAFHEHSHVVRRENNRQGLTIALIITFVIMLVEAAGGWWTNSLALLSDSGHMLADVGSLALSLLAVWFVAKPPSVRKSYGYFRVEILAALLNGVTLFLIAGWIIWEAYHRLMHPPNVSSAAMMVIAFVGLLANIASAFALMRQSNVKDNINLRSAYLHIIGDALGSIGALLAGLLMQLFSWYIADPIISIVVAVMILKGAWGLIVQSIHILMEGTPERVDVDGIAAALLAIDGVVDVHDIHIWSVSSGYEVFSCHMLVRKGGDASQVLAQAIPLIKQRFGIRHTTMQVMEEDANINCCGC